MNAEALTLDRLKSLSIDELKSALSELTGKPPPRMSGREFLTMAVAWYLQARQFGGLSPAARRKLETLRQAYAQGRKSRLLNPSVRFQPGTTIVKEWRGAAYSVTVLTDGFEYDGRKFRSLSEVAREITGTRWNGPAFFGIRKSKPDRERGNG